jgi:hypothetical protein
MLRRDGTKSSGLSLDWLIKTDNIGMINIPPKAASPEKRGVCNSRAVERP